MKEKVSKRKEGEENNDFSNMEEALNRQNPIGNRWLVEKILKEMIH